MVVSLARLLNELRMIRDRMVVSLARLLDELL